MSSLTCSTFNQNEVSYETQNHKRLVNLKFTFTLPAEPATPHEQIQKKYQLILSDTFGYLQILLDTF